MSQRGTIAELAGHLIMALKPFVQVLASPTSFQQFMYRLGWKYDGIPPSFPNIDVNINLSLDKLSVIGDSPSLPDAYNLLKSVKDVFEGIGNIGAAHAPAGVDANIFQQEIKSRLFELLLTDYLIKKFPVGFNFFRMTGIITEQPFDASAGRPPFIRLQFNWDKFTSLVSKPGDIPKTVFEWGTNQFNFEFLIRNLGSMFNALRFPVRMGLTDKDLLAKYTGLPASDISSELMLKIPFFYINIDGKVEELAVDFIPLPAVGGKRPGLIIQPQIPSKIEKSIRIKETVNMLIRSGSNLSSLFGIKISPDGIDVKYPFQNAESIPPAGFGIGFEFKPQSPAILLGKAGETRIELKEVSAGMGVDFRDGKLEASLTGDLKGFALVISPGQGDGFVRKIIGDRDIKVDAFIGIDWTSRHGIKLRGGGGFEIGLHPHITLGPIAIQALQIRLHIPPPPKEKPDLKSIRLDTGVNIKGELGPITFVIENVGFRVDVELGKGNAGPFNIDPGFKPPTGVGVSIGTGGFKGGGFLSYDKEKGEYGGALELTFAGIVSLKAIGILSTKMQDGTEGYSLLIIITAEFTPIQLGFGFTLNGVGGLIGANRTYMIDMLRLGVKDGSLNHILFPKDVVANAPQIINSLKRIFPPQEGHFLIGPMAKLGWGVPTLISIELGLLLEIPRPGFAILGVLRVNLPEENLAIVYIQVNFLGIVDFQKGQLSFDASLFGSRILTFPLTGDMALRLFWKDNANFLLSVGGFHPAFTPPPMDLPAMTRLSMQIFAGNPSLRAEAYMAVTSNTVQFGARAEMKYELAVARVYGFIGFDILIQFNPFYFIAQIAAALVVEVGGSAFCSININITLEGPTPWHARGQASFKIGFGFKVSIPVSIDVSWGEDKKQVLSPVDVLEQINTALKNTANWKAQLPANTFLHVVLKELPPLEPDTVILHPFGILHITQKLVPLGIPIDKFGTQIPDGDRKFDFSKVLLGGENADEVAVPEDFASAQFWEMTDAEKLSKPSFEKKKGGVAVGGNNAPRSSYVITREVVYEVIYVPDKRPKKFLRLAKFLLNTLLGSSAVAQSALSNQKNSPSVLGTPSVKYEMEKYGVTNVNNLQLHKEELVFASEAEATATLKKLIKENPGLRTELQVIPTYQMNTN